MEGCSDDILPDDCNLNLDGFITFDIQVTMEDNFVADPTRNVAHLQVIDDEGNTLQNKDLAEFRINGTGCTVIK